MEIFSSAGNYRQFTFTYGSFAAQSTWVVGQREVAVHQVGMEDGCWDAGFSAPALPHNPVLLAILFSITAALWPF